MINAEAMFTQFVVKHNLPFAVADHFSKMVPKMFPDSKTAKNMVQGRPRLHRLLKVTKSYENKKANVIICVNLDNAVYFQLEN